jgi:WhiB family redox-sensing transcriptional regulator
MNLRDIHRQTWREHAACVGTGIDFFPDTSGRSRHHQAAIATCKKCSVQEACLEYALTAGERHGIWGGLTADRRDNIRRAKR